MIFDPDAPIEPTLKQVSFLERPEFEVVFFGGRGSAKSVGLCMDPLTDVEKPGWKGALLRQSMTHTQELLDIMGELYPRTGGTWRATDKSWNWGPSRLEVAFLKRPSDLKKYWGRGFAWIGIDEIQQWPTPEDYLKLLTSLRAPKHSGIRPRVRASANPLGDGQDWLIDRFVGLFPAETTYTDADSGLTRSYLLSNVFDNPHLGNDYISVLRGLPTDALRRAYLLGEFGKNEGAMFQQWQPDLHVCEPFHLDPERWDKFRMGDHGYTSAACVLWGAEDRRTGDLVIYRELWKSGVDVDGMARLIRDAEKNDGQDILGVLDPQAWTRTGTGITPGERYHQLGVRWWEAKKGPNSRVIGAWEMHRRLSHITETVRGDGVVTRVPGIRFFSDCTWCIKTIPRLEPKPYPNQEDVKEFQNDHAWDALRYGLRYRPIRDGSSKLHGIDRQRWLAEVLRQRRDPRTLRRSPITGY